MHGPDSAHTRFLRFLVSGGLNTAITYLIYLVLLWWWPYWAAYSASFACGIVLAYILNRRFVFRQHRGLLSLLGMPLIYLVQYGVGIGLLWLLVSLFGLDARLGPLFVIALTVPLTYWLSKLIFTRAQP